MGTLEKHNVYRTLMHVTLEFKPPQIFMRQYYVIS